MTQYLLALDQGTSSSRSILFDPSGNLVAQAQKEFRQHYPHPGWVEHDPYEIWHTQRDTARQVLQQAGVPAAQVVALGITNQRETTLLWNRRTGRPIHRAIVWQDRRTHEHCARLRSEGLADEVTQRTGLVLDPYFSATKIAWLLTHVPGAREAAERGELAFGTVDTWLAWQLSGGRLHLTDVTNASRTLLWNLVEQRWDPWLLRKFDIPPEILPEVRPSCFAFGETDPDILGAAIPIAGMAGDQQAALFGQACFDDGAVKSTYGTGCFMLRHTGAEPRHGQEGLILTAAAQVGPKPRFAQEGSVFVGGAVVQWLRDNLHAIETSADVQSLAASVPDSGGVVFVPAFTGLGAPYWDATATGMITGLTRGSTIAHIARAALESIAFQSAALLQALGGTDLHGVLKVDGGASANDLLMQFQADLLGIPVVRPRVLETTALGAAYLAGLQVGLYRDTASLAELWQAGRTFEPTLSRQTAAARMAQWEDAVRRVRL